MRRCHARPRSTVRILFEGNALRKNKANELGLSALPPFIYISRSLLQNLHEYIRSPSISSLSRSKSAPSTFGSSNLDCKSWGKVLGCTPTSGKELEVSDFLHSRFEFRMRFLCCFRWFLCVFTDWKCSFLCSFFGCVVRSSVQGLPDRPEVHNHHILAYRSCKQSR